MAGTGSIAGQLTLSAGGTVVPGTGTAASGALSVGGLSASSNAVIKLTLGAGGTHSSLIRTAGTFSVPANQAFTINDLGAQPGVYDNVISGLSADPGTSGWTLANSGYAGTFSYDGAGGVDLTLTSVPEPAGLTLAGLAAAGLLGRRRRRVR